MELLLGNVVVCDVFVVCVCKFIVLCCKHILAFDSLGAQLIS